jgi:D-sedoheptulose 7-phosphate isomerase
MQETQAYLTAVSRLVAGASAEQLCRIVDRLVAAYHGGQRLLLLGNGGSAATASHLVADFQKCIFLAGGKTFQALAVTDSVPLITAWANDTSYENVFAEQVRTWARPDDLVLAISGSGNSPNVLSAVRMARSCGAYTIGLTGYAGGQLKPLVDECVVVPSDNMQQIEDVHMVIGHVLFRRMLERVSQNGNG